MALKRDLGKFLIITLIIITSFIFIGCGADDAVENVADEAKGEKVKFDVLFTGKQGYPFLKGKLGNYYVLDSDGDWQKFWEEADRRSIEVGGPSDAVTDPSSAEVEKLLKKIDFDNQFIVGAVFERPTTGFEVLINEVLRTDDNIIVKLEITGKDDNQSENSAPYQFVSVDTISDLPVKFELSNESTRSSDIDVNPFLNPDF